MKAGDRLFKGIPLLIALLLPGDVRQQVPTWSPPPLRGPVPRRGWSMRWMEQS